MKDVLHSTLLWLSASWYMGTLQLGPIWLPLLGRSLSNVSSNDFLLPWIWDFVHFKLSEQWVFLNVQSLVLTYHTSVSRRSCWITKSILSWGLWRWECHGFAQQPSSGTVRVCKACESNAEDRDSYTQRKEHTSLTIGSCPAEPFCDVFVFHLPGWWYTWF